MLTEIGTGLASLRYRMKQPSPICRMFLRQKSPLVMAVVIGCIALKACSRGILRNQDGFFLAGFHRNLGSSTVLQSELWGVLDGLKLAWHRGHRRLILQMDNMEAFEMVTSTTHDSPISLVPSIFELLNRDWQVNLKLIRSEANMATDFLAKASGVTDGDLRIYDSSPTTLNGI
ncbi:hypothetical protein F3Y22_tig00109949pilonHSYRG00059 [Hibiscus syriacus]|uniref:RNase H type-1 domain-containing protein n=1 Tax=Hibiscus syriacus TaxID=106335 RepID=A0A6A3BX44_HIBSY|nr:hypothetical protein F3Y22_tig00109949pilonHSYRG00059 [Hibiscus syriacus]